MCQRLKRLASNKSKERGPPCGFPPPNSQRVPARMAALGFVSNESKLQAENDGLRLQLDNVINAARSVQDVLRRLWSQHESEQHQIQQLKAELSARPFPEAWAATESGARSASLPVSWSRSASEPAVRTSQKPECVSRVTGQAAAAIKKRTEKKPATTKAEGAPSWEAQLWLADGSSAKLAELLLAPLRKRFKSENENEYENENIDLELIRALAGERDSKEAVHALLEHENALPEIAGFISGRMKELVDAAAVEGGALNHKFVDEYGATEMAFGQQSEFFKGLDGLIGPPNPDLVKGMHGEHCERTDSHKAFLTSNYNIETTSRASIVKIPLLTAGRAAIHRSRFPTAYSGLQWSQEECPRRLDSEQRSRQTAL